MEVKLIKDANLSRSQSVPHLEKCTLKDNLEMMMMIMPMPIKLQETNHDCVCSIGLSSNEPKSERFHVKINAAKTGVILYFGLCKRSLHTFSNVDYPFTWKIVCVCKTRLVLR